MCAESFCFKNLENEWQACARILFNMNGYFMFIIADVACTYAMFIFISKEN